LIFRKKYISLYLIKKRGKFNSPSFFSFQVLVNCFQLVNQLQKTRQGVQLLKQIEIFLTRFEEFFK